MSSIPIPKSTFVDDIYRLFEQEVAPDLEIACGNRIFNVHKAILMARCPFFKAMLGNKNFSEANDKKITINCIDAVVFEKVLKFIYTDNFPADADSEGDKIFELIEAADMYQLERLKKFAENVIFSNVWDVTNDTLIEAIENAKKYNCLELQKKLELLYNVGKLTLISTLKNLTNLSVNCKITALHDGKFAVVKNNYNKCINICDTNNDLTILKLEHNDCINALAVLPNGALASGCNGGTIKIWDTLNGCLIKTLEPGPPFPNPCFSIGPMPEDITSLAVLHDGKLACGGYGDSIKIWDISSGTLVRAIGPNKCNCFYLSALAVLNNNLVSGCSSGVIKIWDTSNLSIIRRLEKHKNSISALGVLPNGSLASGSTTDGMVIWDISNGSIIHTLKECCWSITVLPEGIILIAGSGCIKIWDYSNWSLVRTISTSFVSSLVFLYNGRLVCNDSNVDTIKIWG